MGGVFKTKQYQGEPKIKVAEGKTTIPGATNVVRIIRNGIFEGDIICQAADTSLLKNNRLNKDITSYTINSLNGCHLSFPAGEQAYYLLKPIVKDGVVIKQPELNLSMLQQKAQDNLNKLDSAYKRLTNPHIYGVGLESQLFHLQQNLVRMHTGG